MDTMHKLRAAIVKILVLPLHPSVYPYDPGWHLSNCDGAISSTALAPYPKSFTYPLPLMSLLASAYVFGKRDHMRMGFMADKLTGPDRRYLRFSSTRSASSLQGCHGIRRHLHHKADHDTDYGIPAHLHGMDLHHCSHCWPADYGIQRHERSRYAAQRFQ